MNAPYQRIKIPTAEQWNSAGKGTQRKVNGPPRHESGVAHSGALIEQPIRPLIVHAHSPSPVNPSQTSSLKDGGGAKRMLLVGVALALLLTAVTVFAAIDPDEMAQQPTANVPGTNLTHSTPLEYSAMTSPTTNQTASGSPTRATLTVKVTADRSAQQVTHKSVGTGKSVTAAAAKGLDVATRGQDRNRSDVAQPAGAGAQLDGAASTEPVNPKQTAVAAPQVVAKPAPQTVTSKDEFDEVETRTLALIALGVAGAGALATVGTALATKRQGQKVSKSGLDDLTPVTEPSPASNATATAPAQSNVAPVSKGQSGDRLQRGAASLAYIDQNDWGAALERAYSISTRPGPLNALVSVVGARNANEDYACAFALPDTKTGSTLHCMFVADGCGGHASGREASCLAIRAAAEAVIQAIKLAPSERVQKAFKAASDALISAGRHWDANSLRTTLIVVLADESHYYCGWIGDGGIDLHRANGQWESLLKPHKSGAQNLLAASLGPDQVGQPSFAAHARLPGDRIYIGSDGVFDVYSDPSAFWGSWFETASLTKAPQDCLTELLAKCAEHASFDDNMTVAYLHTPAKLAIKSSKPAPSGLVYGYGHARQHTQTA